LSSLHPTDWQKKITDTNGFYPYSFTTSGFRTNKHHELSTFHFGFLDDHTVFSQGISDLGQRTETNGLCVDNLTTAKPHGHFYLVFLSKKFSNFTYFEVEIVFFGFWSKFDFSGFDNRLFLFGFLLLLFQLIPKFIKIHNPAYWRIGFVGNLDEIEPLFYGDLNSFFSAYNATLGAIGINESNLTVIDIFVDFYFQFLLRGKFSATSFFNVRSSSSYF
jgi:hypothetical protein